MSDAFGHGLLAHWGFEPGVRFLNHGSYGAVPREVLAVQAAWKARMESQPVAFFQDILPGALRESACAVAPYFGAVPERFGFVTNASAGTNAVLRSLEFAPGDEIVTTDHVYNAVRMNLRDLAARTGARVIELPIGLPVQGARQIVAAVQHSITPRTKIILIDHIASASALIMPVAEVIAIGRAAGIPVLVDGAHGPGMVDLDIETLGATWYVGNLHKWMCAPRGAAFIAPAADAPMVHPVVISHDYGRGFTAEFDRVGTHDATAWLATPGAVEFHERIGGAASRQRNRALARQIGEDLARAFGTETGGPDSMFGSMVTIRLPLALPPTIETGRALRAAMWQRQRIEVPVMALAGALWLRISVAAYNDRTDYEGLVDALKSVACELA